MQANEKDNPEVVAAATDEKETGTHSKDENNKHRGKEELVEDTVVGSVIVVGRDIRSSLAMTEPSSSGNNPGSQDAHHAPQPPSFNPIPPQSTQGLATSVVGDLMKVYESMTQSSTPQNPSSEQTATSSPFPPPPPPEQPPASQPYKAYQQAPASSGSQDIQSYSYIQSPAAAAQPPAQHYYAQQNQGYFPPAQGQPYQHPGAPAIPSVPEYPHTQEIVASAATPPAPSQQLSNTTTTTTSSGRSLRKRPSESSDKGGGKTRKKGTNADGRWSKRFSWPDDLHRDFVSAIFDVGLKHSSPSAILEHMPAHEQINSERVKSHLQKYRLHRQKSKKEFMSSYDASVTKFNSSGVDSIKSLASGEVAAHLTYSSVTGADASTSSSQENKEQKAQSALAPSSNAPPPGALMLPKLTEEEKRSPIGTSLGYLLGLFFSLRQQLVAQREASAGSTPGVAGSKPPGGGAVFSPFDAIVAGASQQGSAPPPHPTVPSQWATAPAPDDSQASSMAVEKHDASKAPQSTLTHLEQNSLMKREMQNQRAFQQKIRAFKQQQLDQCRPEESNQDGKVQEGNFTPDRTKAAEDGTKGVSLELGVSRSQGAGEAAEAGDSAGKERSRGLSVGASEEFWGSDPVDDQLFEFLMNP